MIVPVLLAGGTGTRLWPLSRDAMPKQFLPLVDQHSTYQQALKRVCRADLFHPPIILTNEEFRFFAQQQAIDCGIEPSVVLEPLRRDSAAAIAAGAALARKQHGNVVVLALAADQVILDPELFIETCLVAAEVANSGRIVTFGISPIMPKTSYGYIRRGEPVGDKGVFVVDAFVEKPDSLTAARYIQEGYLRNSGNFVFQADTLFSELQKYEPAVCRAVELAVERAESDLGFIRLDPEAFAQAPQKSIDYAVMERTDLACVVESRFRWSDIGSWDAVLEVSPQDDRGNAAYGQAEFYDSDNCLVHSDGRLAVLLGVKDIVLASTPDATLVLPRSRAENVKELVNWLKERGHGEVSSHRKGFRPWGYYDSVDMGDRFQVKRIVVKPAGRLSLQKHMHRAEHWIVLKGTAEVTIGNEVTILHENQSIYIPMGAVHRLANPGRIPLELIEVQTGSYLGEDDIVRIEDVYART